LSAVASFFHLLAAAYIGYVAVRDSDPNLLYLLGIVFFLASALEMLLQQFRRTPTRAYPVVTISTWHSCRSLSSRA